MRILLAVFALLAFAFVACSDDDSETNAQDTPTDATGNGADTGPPPFEGTTFTTERGVEVIEFASGSAEDPTIVGDAVAVHYTGWLEDGTKFDSSRDRGDAFTFTLGSGQVIRGWDEGILGMSPGDERRLIIPPDLAYGEQGFGSSIPPGATLTFDVELIGFGRRATPTAEATD